MKYSKFIFVFILLISPLFFSILKEAESLDVLDQPQNNTPTVSDKRVENIPSSIDNVNNFDNNLDNSINNDKVIPTLDVEDVTMIEGEVVIIEGLGLNPVVKNNMEENTIINEEDLPQDIINARDRAVVSSKDLSVLANQRNLDINN